MKKHYIVTFKIYPLDKETLERLKADGRHYIFVPFYEYAESKLNAILMAKDSLENGELDYTTNTSISWAVTEGNDLQF